LDGKKKKRKKGSALDSGEAKTEWPARCPQRRGRDEHYVAKRREMFLTECGLVGRGGRGLFPTSILKGRGGRGVPQ